MGKCCLSKELIAKITVYVLLEVQKVIYDVTRLITRHEAEPALKTAERIFAQNRVSDCERNDRIVSLP